MASTLYTLKKRIFGSIHDIGILTEEGTNFIKICLDGIKVNYRQNMTIPEAFLHEGRLDWLFILKNKIKKTIFTKKRRKLIASLVKSQQRLVLIGFTNNTQTDESEHHHSIYFDRILTTIGPEQCLFFAQTPAGSVPISDVHVAMDEIETLFRYETITASQKKLLRKLWLVGERIKKQTTLSKTDYENYLCAAWIFFLHVRIWDAVFTYWKPKVAFFDGHYHREGFIYAAKNAGVHLVELQHGLIAREDLFYLLPQALKPFRDQCLFADEILVYGPYWKKLLQEGSEYPLEAIHEIGYYHYQRSRDTPEDRLRQERFKGKKVLLVTTQTKLEKYFCAYIEHLVPTLPHDWVIWIKPHPAENWGVYREEFQHSDKVFLITGYLDNLLSEADLHLTGYSTTIFDALRLRKATWSLMMDVCRDYIERLEKEGLTRVVQAHESVLDLANKLNQSVLPPLPDPREFYSPYCPSAILTQVRRPKSLSLPA